MPLSFALVCRGPLELEWRASASGRSVIPIVKVDVNPGGVLNFGALIHFHTKTEMIKNIAVILPYAF